jgi:hypothetical protein
MSGSGQLGLCYTVKPNCSDLSTRLVDALVTCDRALDTCKLSCVTETATLFFIPVAHSPLGAVGYVTAPELYSQGGEAVAVLEPTSTGRQGPIRAEEHVVTPELSSQRGRARSHVTHDSAGGHINRDVRLRAK